MSEEKYDFSGPECYECGCEMRETERGFWQCVNCKMNTEDDWLEAAYHLVTKFKMPIEEVEALHTRRKPMFDVTNKFGVGIHGSMPMVKVLIMRNIAVASMTPEDALVLAAWLVAIAEPFRSAACPSFTDILDKVQGS